MSRCVIDLPRESPVLPPYMRLWRLARSLPARQPDSAPRYRGSREGLNIAGQESRPDRTSRECHVEILGYYITGLESDAKKMERDERNENRGKEIPRERGRRLSSIRKSSKGIVGRLTKLTTYTHSRRTAKEAKMPIFLKEKKKLQ